MRSPLRRRPEAPTWLVARDISQRAEPDVRPVDRVNSAFITEGTRRLSTLLTGDVPPQHLLRPIHSAGRRRQGHPIDGAPVQYTIKQRGYESLEEQVVPGISSARQVAPLITSFLPSHVLINHNDVHRLILIGSNRLPSFAYLYTLVYH